MPHILLVDDEQSSRTVIFQRLTRDEPEWYITPASTVEEAKSIIQSPSKDHGNVDIVLTDYVMGHQGAEGEEVLKFAKEYDPHVQAIVYTSHEGVLNPHHLFALGAFACIDRIIQGRTFYTELLDKARSAVEHRISALGLPVRRPGQVPPIRRPGQVPPIRRPKGVPPAQGPQKPGPSGDPSSGTQTKS